jgi:DNA-binding beta-propeller fold protein YncE
MGTKVGSHKRFPVLALGLTGLLFLHAAARAEDAYTYIVTIAGRMGASYGGDGGLATSACIKEPMAMAIGRTGMIYIADQLNHRIRRIDTKGIITTVAGNGKAGFSGDGGAATDARLNRPSGVALDAQGNLYISDHLNHRIRKVDMTGIITTVAGIGESGYSGDGGEAKKAKIYGPTGLAVDQTGKLYFSDTFNNRVRRIDTAGIMTTVAGTGAEAMAGDGGPAAGAQLYGPSGLAFDKLGRLYIADRWNNKVRMIDERGIIFTLAGNGLVGCSGDGGLADNARLREPSGVVVVPGGVYIADSMNHRIRRVTKEGFITTIAGDGTAGFEGDLGPAGAAKLNWPCGLASDRQGNVYVADNGNDRIRKLSAMSLEAILLAEPSPVKPGGTIVATMIINNKGSMSSNGMVPSLVIAEGGDIVSIKTGPSPAGPESVDPGKTVSFVWTLDVSGEGLIGFAGRAAGIDSGVGASTVVTAGEPRRMQLAEEPAVAMARPVPVPEAMPAAPESPPPVSRTRILAEPRSLPAETASSEAPMQNVAVVDLQAYGVSSNDAAVIADMIRSELVRSGSCNVVEKQNMEKVLAEQTFQQTGCTSDECAVKLGKILNVQVIIVGSFGKLMDKYIVTLRLVRVETGKIENGDSAKGQSVDEIEAEIKKMVGRLAPVLSPGR